MTGHLETFREWWREHGDFSLTLAEVTISCAWLYVLIKIVMGPP